MRSHSVLLDNEHKVTALINDLKSEGRFNELCYIALEHFREIHLVRETLEPDVALEALSIWTQYFMPNASLKVQYLRQMYNNSKRYP